MQIPVGAETPCTGQGQPEGAGVCFALKKKPAGLIKGDDFKVVAVSGPLMDTYFNPLHAADCLPCDAPDVGTVSDDSALVCPGSRKNALLADLDCGNGLIRILSIAGVLP